jgi:hypothetical protein
MSKLPSMKYEDKIKKTTQVAFGGLRHSLSCGDGELYDMKNLTCREYPILQPREKRMIALQGNNSSSTRYPGIYADNGEIWYVLILPLSSGKKRMVMRSTAWSGTANVYISEDVHEVKMVRFGNRLILMPDKIVVKTQYKIEGYISSKSDFPVLTEAEKGQIRSLQEGLKQKLYQWTGTEWKYIDELYTRMEATFQLSGVKIEDGTVYGEKATANALSFTSFSGYSEGYGLTEDLLAAIHIGDGLEISGLTEAPGNDKTAVVTGVRESGMGGVLFFSDNCFKMPLGENGEPVTEVTIKGTVTLKRSVPDMDFCFEHDNRLWGAKGKTIYASKLGDPNNWNVFEGLSTDAWSLATQKKGELTGGVSYGGYPTFFREDAMVRIYGATPQTFQVSEIAMPGVKTGEHESIAAAGGMLLYLSREGMMIYADEYPVSQTSVFGTGKIEHVMACSDGTRYYAQMTVDGERAIYCYDSKHGLWMKEDDQNLFCMTYDQGTIYGLIKIDEQGGNGVIDLIGDGGMFSPATKETAAVESFAEFGDFTAGTLNRKAVSKLQLRMELEEGASVQISIRYDGGAWKPLWTMEAGRKRSVQIPILPTRCDYYRIKITGTGMWRLYAMAREQYEGSEIH